MPTYEQGVEELDVLKDRCRKAFKRCALQLHPDVTGGDEAKATQFKKLNELVQKIEQLQLRRPQPRMMINPGWGSATTTGTSSGGVTTVTVIFSVNGVRVR